LSKNLGEVLFCLSELEEKTFELYHDLATKVKDSFAKKSYQKIAKESSKHASILKDSAKIFGEISVKTKDCEKGLGEVWKYVMDSLNSIKKKEALNAKELFELSKKLAIIEHSLVEEYNILVKLQTMQYMSKEISSAYNVDIEKIHQTLETIIADEESHRRILEEINEHLENESETKLKSKIARFPAPLKY
jgi:rubrerythrin